MTDRHKVVISVFSLLFISAVIFWYFFESYCWVRGSSQVSFDGGKVIANALFMPFFVSHYGWFVAEIVAGVAVYVGVQAYQSVDDHRKALASCHVCGYARCGLAVERCPECGSSHSDVGPRDTGIRFVVILIVSCFAASATSVVAGEAWMSMDEQAFNRQVRAYTASGGSATFARPRAWPVEDCSLVYVAGVGIHATE